MTETAKNGAVGYPAGGSASPITPPTVAVRGLRTYSGEVVVSLELHVTDKVRPGAPEARLLAQVGCSIGSPLNAAGMGGHHMGTILHIKSWPASATVSEVGGNATLNVPPLYGFDYRLDSPSHWGLHLNAVTGTLAASGTTSSGSFSLSGTDTIWSGVSPTRWGS